MSDMPPPSTFAIGTGLASLYAAMKPPVARAPSIDIDAVAAVAYRDGLAEGAIEAQATVAAERAMLTAARSAFTAATVVDIDAIRGVFITLVGLLAQTVIAAELTLDPAVMARLIDTALAAIVTTGDVVVRTHPDDARYLDHNTLSDTSIGRGAVVVESASFVIADGLATRLAGLIEILL